MPWRDGTVATGSVTPTDGIHEGPERLGQELVNDAYAAAGMQLAMRHQPDRDLWIEVFWQNADEIIE